MEPPQPVPGSDRSTLGDRLHHAGVLALGCWAFGGTAWGPQHEDDSRAAMAAAWDAGLRHWDTAAAYGAGHSESLVGAFLQGRRDQAFLATKGMPGTHPDAILGSLEASLRRLRTDSVDLYYLHWPLRAPRVDLRPHMERLESARARGLLRAIGVSNFSPREMDEVAEAGTIDAHQLCYSLLWRGAEREVIPYCTRHGIAMVAYSPLAQGILAGRFTRNPVFEPGDARANTVFFDPKVWPGVHEAVEALTRVAATAGRPVHHLAIQWVLEQRLMTAVVAGVRKAGQAVDTAASIGGRLAPDVLAEIARISDDVRECVPDEDNIFRYCP